MSKIEVTGGIKLNGSVRIHGAKNAVLPILAATVLNRGESIIHDCPDLKDVRSSIEILKNLGAKVRREGDTLIVDSSGEIKNHIPENLMREMRSSIMFLGAVVARCKSAEISLPGGCELGPRPIDMHLKAIRKLNVEVKESHGYINCKTFMIKGANIHLDFPSVGATENVMLAACLANGDTVITNAAKEPEIVDLAKFLNAMGAKVFGAGTGVIMIRGVEKLKPAEHTAIPDRIVSATYLAGAVISGGDVTLKNVCCEHIESVLSVISDCGATIYTTDDEVRLVAPKRIQPIDILRTLPYPGFPTDVQSPVMAILSVADGTSMIVENIFENRFRQSQELVRMGANITVNGRVAVIRGVERLMGTSVCAMDLRGGASLVVAGLNADGVTEISDIHHIDRGYECIEKDLSMLGANIKRVD